LARKLTHDEDLKIIEMPALKPPEVKIDPEVLKKYEQEIEVIQINNFKRILFKIKISILKAIKNSPMPEDEDDN
jgi:hypothetical protein